MSSEPMFYVNKKKGRRRTVAAAVASEAAAFSSGAATSSSADTSHPARDQERNTGRRGLEPRRRGCLHLERVYAIWRGERRGLGQSRSGDEQAASSAVVRSASTAAELGRAQTPLLEAGAGSENRGPGTLGLGLVSALPGCTGLKLRGFSTDARGARWWRLPVVSYAYGCGVASILLGLLQPHALSLSRIVTASGEWPTRPPRPTHPRSPTQEKIE